ncbi:hypothetical protein LOK49_LG05G00802 [Camellia lanceoleosa]|uniref:Uncharacterized protein n=1 Tax=Camellia lanceoleosa TaxID=1840588 RepID=A0ACC0HVB1_9ERIC|nr:hypothetical protein LOK49_LG05G00802 [Camellia lanceoleosa]
MPQIQQGKAHKTAFQAWPQLEALKTLVRLQNGGSNKTPPRLDSLRAHL